MKNVVKATVALALLALSSAASALILTDVKNPYVFLGEGQSYSVYHNLQDDGVPDQYKVVGAKLRLGFSDGFYAGDWEKDIAKITAAGVYEVLEVDGTHAWGFDIRWLSVGAAGIDSLNNNGILKVTVTALRKYDYQYNDFWWKTSKLVADVVPVPEPGTLGLVALGLAAFGLTRKVRKA